MLLSSLLLGGQTEHGPLEDLTSAFCSGPSGGWGFEGVIFFFGGGVGFLGGIFFFGGGVGYFCTVQYGTVQ